VPFDLTAAGTWAATAAVPLAAAGELDELDDELELLLLPQPAIAAAVQTRQSGAANQLLHIRMQFLLIEAPTPPGGRICN
jgi:hypothetical protein